MADAIVGVLAGNLNSYIQRELGLILGVDNDMRKLSSILITIQAVLEDAESKKIENKPLEKWLAKLKNASFEAADLLEEWADNALHSTYNNEVVNYGLSCFCFKQLHFRHTMSKMIKKIITRFEDIARERSDFILSENVVPTSLQLEESRETGSILNAEVVYGRDDDKKNIIEILLNSVRCTEDLSVLPVIGMGGIGKTTLVQWVYNDRRVISHFDKRAWVCVSDNFEVKRVMKMILESLDGKACDLETLDSVQRQLQGKLSGKKFLLVLDDVWNEDQEKWANLKSVLKCGAQGSSIIVTTRLEPVASMMETLPSCPVTCLSEEESWLLFKDCAFAQGREEVDNLVEIGKEIVKKCVGVPLALKSLGRLMWWKRTDGEWQQVRDSKIWELREEGSGILPALRLSYKHLPPHLKQCFAFCSIYPKDFQMSRDRLIYLWMANGYLQSDGAMELEAFGKLVFDELVHRSFFQEFEIVTDLGEDFATCKMHDLMHDLACLVSANECSVVEVGSTNGIVNCTRHMSLVFDLETEVESSNRCVSLVKSNSRLRTLILLGLYMSKIRPAYILKNLYSLRALGLGVVGSETLPNSIGKMKHLKYLNVTGSSVELLPESICKLRNLKCLILRHCVSLQSLPKGMSKMRGLRHLDIFGCDRLSEMPSGMEQLTQLQTLRGFFVVGPKSGTGVINGLKGMQQLRGTLWIRGVQHVREAEADLVKVTQHLSFLGLEYWYGEDENDAAGELQEKVLEECLQPHPNLKELFIIGFGGANLPSWMGELQNVVKIDLRMCKSCVRLPALGRLPLLKSLYIRNMNSLKCIDDDFYGEGVVVGGRGSAATTSWFPSLQRLEMVSMGSLEVWSFPSAAKEEEEEESSHRHHHHPRAFPCLKELTISRCPKLKAIPCLPCVQNITLCECNEVILRSIPKLPPRSLLTLVIESFEEMTHLPEGTFINSSTAALQSLQICFCHELKSVNGEIQNLTALTSLQIACCHELESLSELEGLLGKLTSLTHLSIQECRSLEHLPAMGIQDFNNSLKELEILGCDKLASVSEGLQYLTSLQILNIHHRCRNLELMSRDDQEEDGFQHLISLQSLTLKDLPKLRALPEGMQHLTMLKSLTIWYCKNLRMLPEWLQHLTSLQSLEIKYCHPDLHKRCDKDKGEDWHIISHIPQLYTLK